MAYTPKNPNWQATMANSSPVVIASDQSAVVVDLGANNDVTVTSSALPTGASTSANQTTIIGHLDWVEGLLTTMDADTGSMLTALQIMDDWDNGASDWCSVSGDVAHDTADAGEPVKIGFKAYNYDGTAPQTAVAEADRVNGIADTQWIQFVHIGHPFRRDVSADYASAQTNTSVKTAPWAWLSLYITDIVISNWATAGKITLLDGSGGTVKFGLYPAINGWVSHTFVNPIKLTANTALCITSTTVTTHTITISWFTAP